MSEQLVNCTIVVFSIYITSVFCISSLVFFNDLYIPNMSETFKSYTVMYFVVAYCIGFTNLIWGDRSGKDI